MSTAHSERRRSSDAMPSGVSWGDEMCRSDIIPQFQGGILLICNIFSEAEIEIGTRVTNIIRVLC